MSKGSTLSGSLDILKRTDGTGGDLSVEGSLFILRNGERLDVSQRESSAFIFTQSEASALWRINHDLNTKYPDVKVIVDGREVFTHIIYESSTPDHIDICFVFPCCGKAILTT